MPGYRHALITAASLAGLVGTYFAHRSTNAAISDLTLRVDRLADRVGADYWRVYADVQADMFGPDDRR